MALVWRWLDGFACGSILLAHGFGFFNAYFGGALQLLFIVSQCALLWGLDWRRYGGYIYGSMPFAQILIFLTLEEVIMTNGQLFHFYPLHPSLWGKFVVSIEITLACFTIFGS